MRFLSVSIFLGLMFCLALGFALFALNKQGRIWLWKRAVGTRQRSLKTAWHDPCGCKTCRFLAYTLLSGAVPGPTWCRPLLPVWSPVFRRSG
jgi:hypothetical protein